MNVRGYSTLSDYFGYEKENEKESKKYRQQMQRYKQCFEVCSETLDFLLEKSNEKLPHFSNIAPTLIMYRLIGSLQSIRTLTLKGYYYDSGVLIRNFYESLGLCVYLKENPEKAEQWFKGGEIRNKKELFKLNRKIFRAPFNAELDEMADVMYKYLCDYVHSGLFANLEGISVSFERKDKIIDGQSARTITVQMPSNVKKEEIDGLPLLALAMVYALLFLFEDILPDEKKLSLAEFLLKQVNSLR